MRDIEHAFKDFKVITSNFIWDNRELQKLVIEACYRERRNIYVYETDRKGKRVKKTKTFSAASVIQAQLKEILEANDKFRDGTIIKQFNSEDEKLKSIIVKELEEDGFEGWVEVSTNSSTEKPKDKLIIPPIL